MKRKTGFTLVELLVVIAIIGILVAMLLPAVQAAREAARKMSCKNHLKQLGLGLQLYHDVYKKFPPGYLANGVTRAQPASAENGSGFAWGALILPFIEQPALHDLIDFRLDARTPSNTEAADAHLAVFKCPSDPSEDDFELEVGGSHLHLPLANYVAIFGYGSVTMQPGQPTGEGIFYRNSATRLADVLDGTSNTICLGERSQWHDFVQGQPMVDASSTWYAAIPGAMRPAGMPMMAGMMEGSGSLVLGHVGQPAIGSMMAMHHPPSTTNHIVNFSSRHPGGIHFVACDGSVRFLAKTVDYLVFRRLGERADGQLINLP